MADLPNGKLCVASYHMWRLYPTRITTRFFCRNSAIWIIHPWRTYYRFFIVFLGKQTVFPWRKWQYCSNAHMNSHWIGANVRIDSLSDCTCFLSFVRNGNIESVWFPGFVETNPGITNNHLRHPSYFGRHCVFMQENKSLKFEQNSTLECVELLLGTNRPIL